MGICFSSDSLMDSSVKGYPASAKIVSVGGDIHEYNLPVSASQVLQAETASSSSTSNRDHSFYFLCNSDFLSYDDYIPEMDAEAQLQSNQMYFVLPKSKLQHKLGASDMAALAVKASQAIAKASVGRRHKKGRVSPLMVDPPSQSSPSGYNIYVDSSPAPKKIGAGGQGGMSRSGSVRRLQKYTSKRAKLAVRSFRLRLSTIYEGAEL